MLMQTQTDSLEKGLADDHFEITLPLASLGNNTTRELVLSLVLSAFVRKVHQMRKVDQTTC